MKIYITSEFDRSRIFYRIVPMHVFKSGDTQNLVQRPSFTPTTNPPVAILKHFNRGLDVALGFVYLYF